MTGLEPTAHPDTDKPRQREVTREEQLYGIPSPEDWQKTRGATPTSQLRAEAQKALPVGSVDPAFPSLKVTGPAQADHIVSVDTIRRKPGFANLNDAAQLDVLNLKENFTALSPAANPSKGNKSFEKWEHSETLGLPVDPKFRSEMRAREVQVERIIQERIDEHIRAGHVTFPGSKAPAEPPSAAPTSAPEPPAAGATPTPEPPAPAPTPGPEPPTSAPPPTPEPAAPAPESPASAAAPAPTPSTEPPAPVGTGPHSEPPEAAPAPLAEPPAPAAEPTTPTPTTEPSPAAEPSAPTSGPAAKPTEPAAAQAAEVKSLRAKARQLRKAAITDPGAVDELQSLYQSQPDSILRKMEVKGKLDPVAEAVIDKRRAANPELASARESRRQRHVASVKVTEGGKVLGPPEQLVSGGVTPEQAAKLGSLKAGEETHTEVKAVKGIPLKAGQIMWITGQYNPCDPCRDAMQARANEIGGTIVYWWPGGPSQGLRFSPQTAP